MTISDPHLECRHEESLLHDEIERLQADNELLQKAALRADNIEKHRDELQAEIDVRKEQRDMWRAAAEQAQARVAELEQTLKEIITISGKGAGFRFDAIHHAAKRRLRHE